MKQLLQNQKSGKLRIEDVPAPVARPGGVIVRNDYSVVSAGTERATVGFAFYAYRSVADPGDLICLYQ